MSDTPPPPPPDGYPPPTQPEAYPPPLEPPPTQPAAYPPAQPQPGYPPPGGSPPAGGPPPTQAGWGAGGGVPPGYGAPPPSGGGGAKPLIIILGVVFGLAALVVVGAVVLVIVGRDNGHDAETVVRTTLAPPFTTPEVETPTTDGAQPGDSALDPDTTDTTTASGQEVSVFSVEVGECFNEPAAGNIDSIEEVDCDQPHGNEVFALFDMPGGNQAPFPGDEAVQAAAQDCIGSLFTDYVGIPYSQSRFGVFPITPTRETWEGEIHDREVVCTANTVDGTPLASSVRDSNE